MNKRDRLANLETNVSTSEAYQVAEESVTETVIYVGESLPNGVLSQYNIFTNGVPTILEEDIKKCPAIKQLMVPISALNETRSQMEKQGSMEHTLNGQILQYVLGSDR